MTIAKLISSGMKRDGNWLERIAPCPRPRREHEDHLGLTSGAPTPPRWTEPPRIIYDHELVLFSKGRFAVEIEGRRYDCPAGTFVIVPPGAVHASWDTVGRPGHRYWSHFDWVSHGPYGSAPVMTFHPARPKPALYRHPPPFMPRRILHGAIPSPERAYELAERLSAMLGSGSSEHERMVSRALLLELLLELLDTGNRKTIASSGSGDLPHRVRDLLEQNLDSHSSLRIQDMLEERLGYSYEHLCRLFRAKYGIPPLKYLNALCVSRAKLLLRDTNLPVAAIAHRLGFRDPLYFSQLFRKMTGSPPSRYRLIFSPPPGAPPASEPQA